MFLVDTDVISFAAPTKAVARGEVLDWLNRHGGRVYLSAITLAEIRRGVALASAKGHARKAERLLLWYRDLVSAFADRILPVDERVAEKAGELLGLSQARGTSPGLPDACIAATAEIHGLVLVTGNVRHYQALGVTSQAPWTGRTAAP